MAHRFVHWIAIAVIGASASSAGAQQNPQDLIRSLTEQVARAEETWRREPYLTEFCPLLASGSYFLHRGRAQAYLRDRSQRHPVIALAAWQAAWRREVEAGRRRQNEMDNAVQAARQRASELQNACTINQTRAELQQARARATPPTSSAEMIFAWNDTYDANIAIGGNGLVTGNLLAWQLKVKAPHPRSGAIVDVTCNGRVENRSGKRIPDPGGPGKMACSAVWKDAGGKQHGWFCQGDGESRQGTQGLWFVIWENHCVGNRVEGDKSYNHKFGRIYLKGSWDWGI